MGKKLGIGAVGAAIVFIMLYGLGIINFGSSPEPTNTNVPVGIVPAFVDQADAGWVLNPDSKATTEMVVWEDPQCPACALFEAGFGPSVRQLIADDVVKVKIRPTTFLDRGYPGRNSARAVNAWACAIEAGVGEDYHDYMYKNQPAKEGDGWTDQQLKDFAAKVGASGAAKTKFDTCVTEGTYYKWGVESTKMFDDAAVPGTPNVSINGVEVPTSVLQEGPSAFVAWVKEQVAK
jgi:protein-disulfide isomerase